MCVVCPLCSENGQDHIDQYAYLRKVFRAGTPLNQTTLHFVAACPRGLTQPLLLLLQVPPVLKSMSIPAELTPDKTSLSIVDTPCTVTNGGCLIFSLFALYIILCACCSLAFVLTLFDSLLRLVFPCAADPDARADTVKQLLWADVVMLVAAYDEEASLQRVKSYWFKLFDDIALSVYAGFHCFSLLFCGPNAANFCTCVQQAPVVLVVNKSDLAGLYPQSYASLLADSTVHTSGNENQSPREIL